MTVTELAVLHLKSPYQQPPPELLATLAKAVAAMEAFNGTGSVFHILQQLEDPSYLYVLGDWASMNAHMEGFIPSDANQQVVGSAAQYLSVDRLAHYEMLHTQQGTSGGAGSIKDAVAIRIEQHIVVQDKKDNFERLWRQCRPALSCTTAEPISLEGWRTGEEVLGKEHEEWVFLTSWNTTAEHKPLESSAEAEHRMAALKDLTLQVDVKHAKKLL